MSRCLVFFAEIPESVGWFVADDFEKFNNVYINSGCDPALEKELGAIIWDPESGERIIQINDFEEPLSIEALACDKIVHCAFIL
jgi:hypothetical protein